MAAHLVRWQVWVMMAALAATVLYWPTLSLPILYDDLLHIRITGSLNWLTVWLPTTAFGFYRPFTFAPLLAIKSIFGYYPAWLLHAINIAQHAVNAALLAALAWRLWRRPVRALGCGLLFAVFPFSYQAIAVYGHNVHPAIAGLFLLGLHTYLSAIRAQPGRAWKWWALTGAIFAVSLLTHESAVLFGVFALLAGWADRDRPSRSVLPSLPQDDLDRRRRSSSIDFVDWLRHPAIAWLIFVGLGAAYIVVYQFLPISRTPQAASVEAGGAWPKALYFLQAAAYPFTWFAHWLRWMTADTLILISVGLTLALAAWAARKSEHRLPLLFGGMWWALASILLGASLTADYLLHGPRLLYLGSAGLALAWAVLIESLLDIPKVGRIAGGLFLALILLTNWRFVSARLADYARLTEPVRVVAAEMKARPKDSGVLLVNLPQWYSPPENTYALGAEFAAMLGHYLFADELIDQNVEGAHVTRAIEIQELRTPTDYAYGVHAQSPLDQLAWGADSREWHVFITHYTPDGPATTHTGWINPSLSGSTPLASFGPYQLVAAEAVACGDTTHVALTWQITTPPADLPATVSAFVHVIDSDQQMLGQADGPPLGLRPQLFPEGADHQIHDVRRIENSASAFGAPAQLRVGIYDYANGQRFPALAAGHAPLPDDIYYLPVTPCQ
jgi:hypothetical protein